MRNRNTTKPRKGVEELNLADVEFIREQVGTAEGAFKEKINPVLKQFNIESAYLVSAQYPDRKQAVVLTFEGEVHDRRQLADVVGKEFALMFRSDTFLDMIFLTPMKSVEISRVAKPFYKKGS